MCVCRKESEGGVWNEGLGGGMKGGWLWKEVREEVKGREEWMNEEVDGKKMVKEN